MSGMGSHQSHKAMTTTWLTPKEIIEDLGPFDTDPCAHPSWPTADRLICLPEDGLVAPWEGTVWLNPPYGRETWRWLDRLAEHGDGIALIFARTETAGFVSSVWEKATAVRFLHGRLHFYRPDGSRADANAGAPSVLVAYGESAAGRIQRSSLPGTFLRVAPELPGAHVTEYVVLPAGMERGDPDERYFALRVEDRGPYRGREGGGWGVTDGGTWLSRSGGWDLPARFRRWQFRWEHPEDALAAARAAVDERRFGTRGETWKQWRERREEIR